MSDLIERLERWGKDEGLQNHFIGSRSARKDCAEAATTIARQQVMLDRALEASFDDKARADRAEAEIVRLRGALDDIYRHVDWWSTWRISSHIRAALSRPHATKGEDG